MPIDWNQKRKQIANALQGSGGPGWGGFAQSVGAGIRANPLLRWGPQGAAAPEMAGGQGLMGATQGQMMAQANASLQGAPGFNYVPPPSGPNASDRPVAAGAPAATPMENMASLLFLGPEAHSMVSGASEQELENMKNAGFFGRGAGGSRR